MPSCVTGSGASHAIPVEGNGYPNRRVVDAVTHVPPALDEARLLAAVDELAAADPALGAVVARFGPPPMWGREPGFPTLVHLILEQQVSLASAQAAFDRLRATADPLTPRSLLGLDDAQLLAVGFSRQKARYARALASAVEDGIAGRRRPRVTR